MKKHRVVKDFQLITDDKKIFILKAKSVIENYRFLSKDIDINIDSDLIDNNPEYFQEIDWKQDLNSYIKSNKLPQPAQLSKKLIPFIESLLVNNLSDNSKDNDLDIQIKKIQKKESDYREDILNLEKREESLRDLSKSLSTREFDILKRTQDLMAKELSINSNYILSSEEKDMKYKEISKKLDDQLKVLIEREKILENNVKLFSERESILNKKFDSISCSINHPDCAIVKFRN